MRVPLVAVCVALAVAGALAYVRLARPLGPDPAARAALAQAVSAVDRELAGNLGLTGIFDQTRQPVTLEVGEFARHRATLEAAAPSRFALLADLYGRVAAAEAAMERRGPANSVRDADRAIVEGWEGDARAAQRALRASLGEGTLRGPRAAIARLRGGRPPG